MAAPDATIHAVLHQVLQDQPQIWDSIDRRLRALSATDDLIARLDGSAAHDTAAMGRRADAAALGAECGHQLRKRAGPGFFD